MELLELHLEKDQEPASQFPSMSMGNNLITTKITAEAWLVMSQEKRIDTGAIAPTNVASPKFFEPQ